MAVSLISTLTGGASNFAGALAGSINTTGANFLIAGIGYYGPGGSPGISDSKGNTWVGLTAHLATGVGHRFFYVKNATVGTSHSFTLSGGEIYPGAVIHAFANVLDAVAEAENGASATAGGTSLATGSVTPTLNGSLVLAGFGGSIGTGNTPGVTGGLTQTTWTQGANNFCSSTGYLVQGTAAAINPTWSWGSSSPHGVGVSIAVFKPVAAPASSARTETFLVLPM